MGIIFDAAFSACAWRSSRPHSAARVCLAVIGPIHPVPVIVIVARGRKDCTWLAAGIPLTAPVPIIFPIAYIVIIIKAEALRIAAIGAVIALIKSIGISRHRCPKPYVVLVVPGPYSVIV
jgi:hypothetical protein